MKPPARDLRLAVLLALAGAGAACHRKRRADAPGPTPTAGAAAALEWDSPRFALPGGGVHGTVAIEPRGAIQVTLAEAPAGLKVTLGGKVFPAEELARFTGAEWLGRVPLAVRADGELHPGPVFVDLQLPLRLELPGQPAAETVVRVVAATPIRAGRFFVPGQPFVFAHDVAPGAARKTVVLALDDDTGKQDLTLGPGQLLRDVDLLATIQPADGILAIKTCGVMPGDSVGSRTEVHFQSRTIRVHDRRTGALLYEGVVSPTLKCPDDLATPVPGGAAVVEVGPSRSDFASWLGEKLL